MTVSRILQPASSMHLPATCLRHGLFAAVFAVAATALSAADSFEGRVEMKITDTKSGGAHVINYALKEGKLRMDFPKNPSGRDNGGGSGGMIVDMAKREVLVLMEMPDGESGGVRKMYMRQPMPQPGETPPGGRPAEAAPISEPVATGRTEVIAGYTATEYKVTGKNGEVSELWLAKGLGTFMFPAAQNPMGRGRSANASPAWEKLVRDGGFFPLRVITRDAGGAEKMRMEVTKIEKTSLPDALFSTEGYTEFQIPGFGGGLNPFKH
jgi:hypothetical protein